MKPVSQIFDLVSDEAKGGQTTDELFDDTLRIVDNRRKGLQTIDKWFFLIYKKYFLFGNYI